MILTVIHAETARIITRFDFLDFNDSDDIIYSSHKTPLLPVLRINDNSNGPGIAQ